jgi:two-component system, NarL family, response regulator NreC
MSISVLIADDHGVLRGGLRALLRAEPDLVVVAEAADGHAALSLATTHRPDVVLADISMPGPSGIDIAQRLSTAQPDTRVLILTMHEDPGLVDEALQAGAAGYIVKRAVESELIKAIRVVAAGGHYVHPDMLPATTVTETGPAGTSGADAGTLSDLETRAVGLIAQGHTTRQVAEALCLTLEAVDALRNSILQKLGLRGRIELTKYAREHGLLD